MVRSEANSTTGHFRIADLRIGVRNRRGTVPILQGVSLEMAPGEIHCVAGESGSGKTVTCRGALCLLPTPPFVYDGGSVFLGQTDIHAVPPRQLREIRGSRVGMVFQEPREALNPSLTVAVQLGEHMMAHLGLSKEEATKRSLELLSRVELPRPEQLLERYPHELSGGMQQRLGIAIATACDPEVLVADEPTSSLDSIVETQILELLLRLRTKRRLSVLCVTHDLAVVGRIADTVSILYAGRIVEVAPRRDLFDRPLHPYTALLMRAIPRPGSGEDRLATIPGTPPMPEDEPMGCPFHPRCPAAKEICRHERPPLEATTRAAGPGAVPSRGRGTPGHLVACHFPGAVSTLQEGQT